MKPRSLCLSAIALALGASAMAQEPVTYRGKIGPMVKAQCVECHGADAPLRTEFKLNEEKYKKDKLGPRMTTYEELVQFVAWPDTGALMRRLDDGSNTADKKPGNMHKYLGETDAERAANLALVKAWVGPGAWNLNRFAKRGDVPAITKDQLDLIQVRY